MVVVTTKTGKGRGFLLMYRELADVQVDLSVVVSRKGG